MIARVAGHAQAPAPPRQPMMPRTARRRSQRERLLAAAGALVARDGYPSVTVGQIIAAAGVSRPTFYEYFTDKEDCFLAALASPRAQLLAAARSAVAAAPCEHATAAVLQTVIEFASAREAETRMLISEPLAAGGRALDAREQLLGALAALIEDASARAPREARVPDIAPPLLLGVLCRLLASRMRGGEPLALELLGELLGWVEVYSRPVGARSWSTLRAPGLPPRSPYLPPAPLQAPPRLPPGRPRMPEAAVAENHRLRIMFATAELVQRQGYAATTVTEIARLAGVDGRVFYRLFASKQQALAEVHELLFRHVMAATAGAFVAGEDWPTRLWEATRACTQCLAQNPTLTYAAFVEGHAAGAPGGRSVESFVHAFTIFLQEGYRSPSPQGRPTPRRPSTLELEAIVTAVFELGYRHARGPDEQDLTGLVDHIVFLALAPFLGVCAAEDFLRGVTPDAKEPPPRRHGVLARREATGLLALAG